MIPPLFYRDLTVGNTQGTKVGLRHEATAKKYLRLLDANSFGRNGDKM